MREIWHFYKANMRMHNIGHFGQSKAIMIQA